MCIGLKALFGKGCKAFESGTKAFYIPEKSATMIKSITPQNTIMPIIQRRRPIIAKVWYFLLFKPIILITSPARANKIPTIIIANTIPKIPNINPVLAAPSCVLVISFFAAGLSLAELTCCIVLFAVFGLLEIFWGVSLSE